MENHDNIPGQWTSVEAPHNVNSVRLLESAATPLFEPASTIKHRSVKWAIDDHIPLEDVTLFAGPKKSGKSLTIARLIACFTNNVPFAPGVFVNTDAQGYALLYNGERAKESFASPRCAAAGADMSKVYIRDKIYSLEDVIADIEKAPPNVRLIGIDPLKAFADVAHMSDKRARQLLDKLADIARRNQAAVVIMHHVTLRRPKGAPNVR